VICVRKLFLNRNPTFIFRMSNAASVDKRLLIFWFQWPRSFGSLRLNQKVSPSPSIAWLAKLALLFVRVPHSCFFCLFFIRGLFVKLLYVFEGASFFIGSLFVKPLYIFWVPLFFIECLSVKSLYIYGGASFFIGCIFVKPLHIFSLVIFLLSLFAFLGVPLFYRRSFC
jgi:hypothetical protein